MSDNVGQVERFQPFLALHEFETWVFAASSHSNIVPSEVAQTLAEVLAQHDGHPEAINDSPTTAPSKRIKAVWPRYTKTVDGIEVIKDAGLWTVAEQCPRLQRWLTHVIGAVSWEPPGAQ